MSAQLCGECGASLAEDQHYCLICGARAGVRSPQLLALLERIDQQRTSLEPVAGRQAAALDADPPAVGLRLPSSRIAALLVLGCLGFGILLGSTAGSRVADTLAASVAPLKLVLPAQGTSGSEASTAASPAAQAPESEVPPVEEQPTPTASVASPTPAPAATTPSEAKKPATAPVSPKKLPAIKHVFVIMLSEEPYAAVFGPESQARYLAHTLERDGTLLIRYDAVAHAGLADELALLSGQGPTTQTSEDCPVYSDLAPATPAADGQVLGSGCVYPATTATLVSQMGAKHLSARAYLQGLGEGAGTPSPCAPPQSGQPDPTTAPGSGAYATFRNPFLYFHALSDPSRCAGEDLGLAALRADLASAKRTANFSYIVPDRCHDASPIPCTSGAPAGVAPADAFLAQVVPTILASKAYKQDGLLAITVDQAPASGEFADSSSCCAQPTAYPNLAPSTAGGHGGGTVGALLLSPFLKGAVTSQEPYNHFSLLRTIEDLFALRHLGYAALPAVKPLDPALFSAAKKG